MFGPLGFQELLVIFVLALLIFGPKRLPQIGRTLGRGLGEFRRATSDLKRSIELEVDQSEDVERVEKKPPRIGEPEDPDAPV